MNKKEKLLKEIEKLFNKYNLSGIVTIPQNGTFSLFSSEGEKLVILHHAKIELKKLDLEVNKMAEYENKEITKKYSPRYV